MQNKNAAHVERAQDLFEMGESALSASNGKFYICTEHYGQAVKLKKGLVSGTVKLANPPKKVEFFELPFMTEQELDEYLSNPDNTVDYTNTRHLYWRIKELFPETPVSLTRGRIYVNGYKIAWRKLGYEIYDRYRKCPINEQDDNSDYWNSELVLPLVVDSISPERMDALREAAEKKRKTIILRTYREYRKYIEGKSKDTDSPLVEYRPNVTDPRLVFMANLEEYLSGELPEKKIRIRFKKRTKDFVDSGRRLLKFLMLNEKVVRKEISKPKYLKEVETLLY